MLLGYIDVKYAKNLKFGESRFPPLGAPRKQNAPVWDASARALQSASGTGGGLNARLAGVNKVGYHVALVVGQHCVVRLLLRVTLKTTQVE